MSHQLYMKESGEQRHAHALDDEEQRLLELKKQYGWSLYAVQKSKQRKQINDRIKCSNISC